MVKSNFYVITGGPGVGKTTLINALADNGYRCIPEVAREIIKHQQQNGENALPWKNKIAYSELMLKKSIEDYKELAEVNEIIFFDRGIPDTLAYNQLIHIETDNGLYEQALDCRYNPVIFLLPPWEEIYHADDQRKQDFQEAVETYHIMKKTYFDLGYSVVEVPKVSIMERVDFIIRNIK